MTVIQRRSGRPAERASTPASRIYWRKRSIPVAASAIATAVLVGAGAWMLAPSPPERRVSKVPLTLPEGQRLPSSSRMVVAISPDGEYLAYMGTNSLYVKGLSEFDAHPIPGTETEGITNPVFSPDGRSIGFYSTRDVAFKRVAVVGGSAVTICPAPRVPTGLTWDSTGLTFGQGPAGIFRCRANAGKPEQLVTVAADEWAHGPQILPGGEWVLFTLAKDADGQERWDKARIVAHSLKSGERRTIVEGGSDARYLSTGHLVYALGGRVYARGFDLARLATTSDPVLVVDGVKRGFSAATGSAQFVVSESGDLLYVPGPARGSWDVSLVMTDRANMLTPMKVAAGRYAHVRASRDGKHLAIDTDDGKEANIYLYEIAGTQGMNRLTFGGRNLFPVWAPEGQRLAFQSDRGGTPAIYVQRTDGTEIRQLTKPGKDEAHIPESWSPDGRYLSYAVLKNGLYTLWTLSPTDGKTARFRDVESSEPIGSVFAPIGGWIAYHALRPGDSPLTTSSGVYVEPFPPTGTRYQAPKINRDYQPVWATNGTELLYVGSAASGQLQAVTVTTKAGAGFGTPTGFPFTVGASRISSMTRAFDVLPDGRLVGLIAGGPDDRSTSSNSEMRLVLNWIEELKRIVPRH